MWYAYHPDIPCDLLNGLQDCQLHYHSRNFGISLGIIDADEVHDVRMFHYATMMIFLSRVRH